MEQIISFETAKLSVQYELKTLYWYSWGGSLTFFDVTRADLIPAPTQAHLQTFLRNEKKVLVFINPIDSWDSWRYTILMEDLMSPFYEPGYNRFNESKTYEDALEAGLKTALEIM